MFIYAQAVKAPKELVLAVLSRLKRCGVEVLVAPYEADAQVNTRVSGNQRLIPTP